MPHPSVRDILPQVIEEAVSKYQKNRILDGSTIASDYMFKVCSLWVAIGLWLGSEFTELWGMWWRRIGHRIFRLPLWIRAHHEIRLCATCPKPPRNPRCCLNEETVPIWNCTGNKSSRRDGEYHFLFLETGFTAMDRLGIIAWNNCCVFFF